MNDIRRIIDQTLADRPPAELANSLTQQIAARVDEAVAQAREKTSARANGAIRDREER